MSEVIEKFIKEMKGGYGNSDSCVSPCKEIIGVSMSYYNSHNGEMWAMVEVNAEQQSPYGDRADTSESFRMTYPQIQELERALLAGEYDLTPQLRGIAINGLGNIMGVLDKVRPERMANEGTLPDLTEVHRYAANTFYQPLVDLIGALTDKLRGGPKAPGL